MSASLGEESIQEDREEEPQETHQAPHPAGKSPSVDFSLQVVFCVLWKKNIKKNILKWKNWLVVLADYKGKVCIS